MRRILYVHYTIRSKTRLLYTVTRIHYLQKNVLAVKLKIFKNALCVIGAKGKYQETPTRFFLLSSHWVHPIPTTCVTRIIYMYIVHREKKYYDSGRGDAKIAREGGEDLMTRQEKNVQYCSLYGSTRTTRP
jgi:hypothetical protein